MSSSIKIYEYIDADGTNLSWSAAKTAAAARGYSLAMPKTIAELNKLNSYLDTVDYGVGAWIGLKETSTEGVYGWDDGTSLDSTATNWADGEPNNAFGGEAYVHLIRSYNGASHKWNDDTVDAANGGHFGEASKRYGYIAEYTVNSPSASIKLLNSLPVYAGQQILVLSAEDSTTLSDLTFEFTIIQQPNASAITIEASTEEYLKEITPAKAGSYTIRLAVENQHGLTDTANLSFTVSEFTTSPTADAGLDKSAIKNKPVVLNGGGSFDPDGDELSYLWSVISKPNEVSTATVDDNTIATPQFTFDTHGAYIIRLTVRDPAGNSGQDTVTVLVEDRLEVLQFVGDGAISIGDRAGNSIDSGTDTYNGRSLSKFSSQCVYGITPQKNNLKMSVIGKDIADHLFTTEGQASKPHKFSDFYGMICCLSIEQFEVRAVGLRSFRVFFAASYPSYAIDAYELQVSLASNFSDLIHEETIANTANLWEASNACPETTYYVRIRTKKNFTNPSFTCYSEWSIMQVATLNFSNGVDVVYLIDNTGSMRNDINATNSATSTFVATLAGITSDWRLAGFSYNDPGAQRQFDWTQDESSIRGGTNFGAHGGGDAPEATYYGIGLVIGTQVFRENVAKVIIIITDAGGKNTNGWNSSKAIEAANSAGVILVGISTSGSATAHLRALSNATGGVTVGASSGTLGQTLSDLFTTTLIPKCGTNGILEGEASLGSVVS